jgi:hypothetical protein
MTFTNEQLKPNKGAKVITQDAQIRILQTLDKQNNKGFQKYGSYLSTFNGRDSIRDMWEEIADLVNYAEALSQEYERMREMLFGLYYDVPKAKEYMLHKFTEEELEFITPGR